MKSLAGAFARLTPDGLHTIEFEDENLAVYLDGRLADSVDQQLRQRGIGRLSRTE